MRDRDSVSMGVGGGLITCLKLTSIGAEHGHVAINQIDLLIVNLRMNNRENIEHKLCNFSLSLRIWMSRGLATTSTTGWVIHWNSSTSLDAVSDKTIASITTMFKSVYRSLCCLLGKYFDSLATCKWELVILRGLQCGVCDMVHTHTHMRYGKADTIRDMVIASV